MANSRFEYTRNFETNDAILPNTWIVVRIDGRGFHRISACAGFEKPNDAKALTLMNKAAEGVLRDVAGVVLGYGHSDEYSFVLPPNSTLFSRRASKLVSTIVSTFTAYYIAYWPYYFGHALLVSSSAWKEGTAEPSSSPSTSPLGLLPTFDGRTIVYPTVRNLRDYLSWRQVDCHINNLYNTTFHNLVQRGSMNAREAEDFLKGTLSSDKHEILFSRFGINYNNEPAMFRRGSIIHWDWIRQNETNASSARDSHLNATSLSSPGFRDIDPYGSSPSLIGDHLDQGAQDASNHEQEDGDMKSTNTDVAPSRRKRKKKTIVVSHIDITGEQAKFWKETAPGWKVVRDYD